MFGEVLCLPILPINHTETDRDTKVSHMRETENSDNEAEQPSQKGLLGEEEEDGKNGSSLCSRMLGN